MTDHRDLIMKMLILCVLAALFGLLHIVAAASQLRKQRYTSHWTMLIGGVLMLLAVVLCVTGSALDWTVALFASLLICMAAFMNGRRSGNLHWQHHVIRVSEAIALVIGFMVL